MVLEAVMVCMDNSEFMRNGDYSPSRLVAQNETINLICGAKTESNMESTVGFLSMGGRVRVHCAPTRNLGMIMSALKDITVNGKSNFIKGLKTAQLALKNRQNKNQKPRIVLFAGSPLECEIKELKKLGKNFKKNSIAVDVVNFGSESVKNENVEKLEAFINEVNNDDNSHLVNIPPGPHLLSDMVLTSAILGNQPARGNFGAGGGGAAGAGGGIGSVNAAEDPELAYVLRISMEEARDRQKREAEAKAAKEGGSSDGKTSEGKDEDAMDEDDDFDEDDEEAALAAAMALSMEAELDDAEEEAAKDDTKTDQAGDANHDDIMEVLQEQDFLDELIESTGVNKDDLNLDGDKKE